MSTSNPKIIFVGTADFGVPILDKLVGTPYQPQFVITSPDKPAGRQQALKASPIKNLADRYMIPLLQPKNIGKIADQLKEMAPDLLVVVAYGQILPKVILDIPKQGSLNIHGSLLPKYRGPSPIQTAILNGEKETGVTLMLIDAKVDHGPILAQTKTSIKENDNAESLHDRLAYLAADLLLNNLPAYFNNTLKPQIQNESEVTMTKILTRSDGQLDLEKGAQQLLNQIRAYDPWPGTWLQYKDKRLKILKASVVNSDLHEAFKTAQDYLLPELVQPEGKKTMSWDEFLRGLK